ncbi:MAG: hypothetical protein CMD16_03450 [Flavobacteriales bacterium]|nr:hypothetical protein [Flavobacteriales bacterium]|tara:strand:+ start:6521 stop:8533 length:2013 start_codon:yes stop_codon:yes gene_type:complete
MKKIILLLSSALIFINVFGQITFCENFDSYTNGDPIAATSADWEIWPTPTSTDVSVTNVLSSSGSNSLYLFSGPTQGTQDVLLPFGTSAPYELGVFEFSSMFYVNQGTGAYFNFQAENIAGTTWSLDVKMDLGIMVVENTGSGLNYLTSTYPENQWFEIKVVSDLTNNMWEVFIDNQSQGTFTNIENKIASLNLYPIVGHEFYVDDVCWSYTEPTLEDLNAQVISVAPIAGLTGQNRWPSVEVRNLGLNNITSFDVEFLYNGVTLQESVSGVNLATTDIYTVNFDPLTNMITLIGGINIGTATVTNVNGLGPDDDPSDDSMNIQIEAIDPALGKLVIGEEATGTWCGWCPRGAVALNWMDHDYEGYWQGIAVHNGDPMTDADYDNGLFVVHGGSYPSGVVDRTNNIDPSAFKEDFLQRITVEPNGIITNGAELTGNTLKVNLTTNFQNSVSGSYKLACVLVEDSVTGTTNQYYQANSYSGGSAGSLVDVDGSDWANKPSQVPASQMIYRHVARGIAPSFNGGPLPNTSYNSGDSETLCFEFTLDPSWDQSKIHIVGMLLDNSGLIDNASSTSIADAINNGYNSCATTSIGVDLNGPDRINFFPNPATDNIYISNVLKTTNIKIYDIQGRLVLEKETHNKEYLNISSLAKGVYQVTFEGENYKEKRKLIKE